MRLTCPNCDAQYEVPDEVIPPEGRDVQCSNCGHTWFQPPAGEALDTDQGDAGDGFASNPTPVPEEDTNESPDQRDDQDDWDEDEDDFDNDPEPAEPALGRGVGPDVSDILREEAAREAELRARETEALESQPDLGLDAYPGDEPGRRAREAQDRMARMRGQEPVAQEADSTSRRGLLPDIEEINSSLRNSDGSAVAPATVHAGPARKRRPGGFMRGFLMMLIFGAVLFLLYANAPLVARTLPQADPMLSAYVALVDQARLWLEAQAGDLMPR
ncbi:zinc-ribbon domain-containing protein [Ruegeria pomeroyi]|uniref:Zinc-ribbon domain-containing protein n=1 Tax=Ruegeria alba TaxID=2916756 RepID=A0ABS9NUD3_9RHOB|nr:zinc-ribbon domain-containing protein [Ruegeria alba]MCE8512155.1 zinc-ribbon domain-containing protein [Ruegeria pomeroyi]MCE8520724.1 zinc-ribbon domain-containing protein [Ruegeria pomeroyi]MCE8524723.1 zinc-ribbon domain-containing protein [Ruegeria pomeroyi]MCE8528737.1 zinc-ribbon domain-containing protein [Ruegeria pomeroyi]MCE8532843.1 zinc-ribbon domain-containing protein [Ruegeria pomeroyi]